jgi:hypothetical protein
MSNDKFRVLMAVIVFAIGVNAAVFVWINRDTACIQQSTR